MNPNFSKRVSSILFLSYRANVCVGSLFGGRRVVSRERERRNKIDKWRRRDMGKEEEEGGPLFRARPFLSLSSSTVDTVVVFRGKGFAQFCI